jgi:hypothetical protein
MTHGTYYVVKFNKRTGKKINGIFFSALSEAEATEWATEQNANLPADEKDENEFRCSSGDPSHRSMGPMSWWQG